MGILLVYDVTDDNSFANVRNWMRQIDQNAAANVNRILIANKCDCDASERVCIYIIVYGMDGSVLQSIHHMRFISINILTIIES
mgnify:CR=1 FL=1